MKQPLPTPFARNGSQATADSPHSLSNLAYATRRIIQDLLADWLELARLGLYPIEYICGYSRSDIKRRRGNQIFGSLNRFAAASTPLKMLSATTAGKPCGIFPLTAASACGVASIVSSTIDSISSPMPQRVAVSTQ